jgi:Glycosyltransferase family 87
VEAFLKPDGISSPKRVKINYDLLFLAFCVFVICLVTQSYLSPEKKVNCIDFDLFYAAGSMAAHGSLLEAYATDQPLAMFHLLCQKEFPALWVQPPPFGLIALFLAQFPIGIAYALFTAVTLTVFFYIVQKVSGPEYSFTSKLFCLPAVVGVLLIGQTGLLTAIIIGLFAQSFLSGHSKRAGGFLGLMIIKPHLAIGLSVFCLFRRQWATLAAALFATLVIAAISILFFGETAWIAFFHRVQEIGGLLGKHVEALPLGKMTSVYAGLFSSDLVSSEAAKALQLFVAAACLIMLGVLCYLKARDREIIAFAILCSFGLTPYAYFYDWPALAISAALLLPSLPQRKAFLATLVALPLSWIATGWVFLRHESSLPSSVAVVSLFVLTFAFLASEQHARESR